MLINSTIKLKLSLTDSEKQHLLDTIKNYSQCIQEIVDFGYTNGLEDKYKLHRELYRILREEYKLPSQLICSSITKGSECLKSVKKSEGSKPRVRYYNPIRYDERSSTIWMDKRLISLATINGREKISIKIPVYYKQYLEWKICSRDLLYNEEKDCLFFHITYETHFKDSNKTGELIGIDLGLNNIAVTTQNKFYSGRKIKAIKNKYFRLRRALQRKGTRSAKRKLIKIGRREQRFNRDTNHCISKRIVSSIKPNSVIVLEQLRNIRKRMNGNRSLKRRLHSWAFYQLQQFLTYKAIKKSIVIKYVSAKYTSTKCSNCGHYHRGQRTRHRFKCQQCGFELNADLNGARNIKRNYQVSQGTALGDGLSVNQPIVANCDSEVSLPR